LVGPTPLGCPRALVNRAAATSPNNPETPSKIMDFGFIAKFLRN
jgi:hypothetical protein